MKQLEWRDGNHWPAIGLGTWRMGESADRFANEVAAVRMALEMGYRVIDSAEMYGEGGAERVVGQAVAESIRLGTVQRDELFIVSKVYPHNASRKGMPIAIDGTLQRLGLDHVDLYLLHWPGSHPLEETVTAFERMKAAGQIKEWGVSNFDLDAMIELKSVPDGALCATNQVYHSIGKRAVEFDLLPFMQTHRMPLMAYSPLDQGATKSLAALAPMADRLGISTSQIALARLMAMTGVMPIPKAVNEAHLRANLDAAGIELDVADIAEIDRLYPPPTRRMPLPML